MSLYPNLTAALEAHADQSFRVRQRVCGFFLGLDGGGFTQKELRVLCKSRDSIHPPTFARSLAQDADLFVGSRKAGFALTEKGLADAEAMFGVSADKPIVPVVVVPVVVPVVAAPHQEPQEPVKASEVPAVVEVAPDEAPQAVAAVAAVIVATPKPSRVLAAEMLAALFREIESGD